MKELNCTEPSISFVTTPANFTSAYKKAATFQSQFCQISKSFGEPLEKVLYVVSLVCLQLVCASVVRKLHIGG